MAQQPRVTDAAGMSGDVTGLSGDVMRGSSIRPLSRLLGDAVAVWAFSGDGRLVFASAGCGHWLNVHPEQMIGLTGASDKGIRFDDPLEAVVFSLRPLPPPASADGPLQPGQATAFVRLVSPPAISNKPLPIARRTLFIPIVDDNATAYLAIADIDIHREPDLASNRFRGLIDAVQQQLATEPRLLFSPLTIGGSVWAERLQRQVAMAARSTEHVTIRCPQGGQGETLARLIHSKSHQSKSIGSERGQGSADGLIKVAGSLMDAELFDATTGGLVNQLLDSQIAKASLLVLDIDQMPHEAQERLALLMHNHGERLRVFATTPLSSHELTVKLLTDLATQLGLIEIFVPALGERIEDLPMIAAAMLQRRQAGGETAARQIGRETLDRMILYPWPNNYEELDAAIRNAARLCRGETIHVEHLPLAIRSFGNADVTDPHAEQRTSKIVPLDQALADAERRFIRAALERSGGNRAAAARLLEISRGRLLRRIEQLGGEDVG